MKVAINTLFATILPFVTLCPSVCTAEDFSVEVEVQPDGSSSFFNSGSFTEPFDDKYRPQFGITETELRNHFCDFYYGCPENVSMIGTKLRPEDINKSPAWPGYPTYRADVLMTLRPTKVEIESNSEPALVAYQVLENTFDKPATFHAEVYGEVTDSWEQNWSNTQGLSLEQSFSVEATFFGSSVGSETTFGFSSEWGEGGSCTTTYTVGSSGGVSVELDPGEKAVAVLEARTGTATIKTTYDAQLSGKACAVRKSKVNGAITGVCNMDIDSLLDRQGAPSKVSIVQEADVSAYHQFNVKLMPYVPIEQVDLNAEAYKVVPLQPEQVMMKTSNCDGNDDNGRRSLLRGQAVQN